MEKVYIKHENSTFDKDDQIRNLDLTVDGDAKDEDIQTNSLKSDEKESNPVATTVPATDLKFPEEEGDTEDDDLIKLFHKPGENGNNPGMTAVAATDLKFEKAALSSEEKKKILEIQAVLSEKNVDISKLQALAKSEGGFISDEIRKYAWPKVLGIDTATATPAPTHAELEAHPEYQQVVMDVNRSLKRFPPGIPYDQRVALQDQLTRLILRVIIKYPHLRYYQGYHDVAVTFLLVVGEDDAFQIMEKLSTGHLKDCMEPTMDKTSYLLNYIYPLIQRLNPSLYDYLERADVGTMFCLAWFLTWYGHSLNRYNDVVRLYDYFLASPPLMPLYLAATLVAYRQDEIFEVECDMAYIHNLLSKIPDDLPFEQLLKDAEKLYQKYPPESIEKEVRERFQKELQMRQAGPHRRTAATSSRRNLYRFVPRWIAHPARISYWLMGVTVTATLAGLYAYLRGMEPVDAIDSLPYR